MTKFFDIHSNLLSLDWEPEYLGNGKTAFVKDNKVIFITITMFDNNVKEATLFIGSSWGTKVEGNDSDISERLNEWAKL